MLVDVLLYDLTSTYAEGAAESNPMMRRGYARNHRPDCEQMVIALIVNNEGFPFGYETFNGNRADVSTMETILRMVERSHPQSLFCSHGGSLEASGENHPDGPAERSPGLARTAGRAYMLHTNLQADTAEELWSRDMQLTEAEASFRALKSELSIQAFVSPSHRSRALRTQSQM